jgi:hypothetical protein
MLIICQMAGAFEVLIDPKADLPHFIYPSGLPATSKTISGLIRNRNSQRDS